MNQLRNAVADKGDHYLNELFSKTDKIENKKFISCMTIQYNFTEEEANMLADELSNFGVINLKTLQTKLIKN